MFKRILLFVAVNALILITILLVTRLLGVDRFLTAGGMNYQLLLGFAAVVGFGGAFISLAMSRVIARWSMGVQIIEPGSGDWASEKLLNQVHALASQAGIGKMPQVGIYDSEEVNAFATGPSRNRSLVAVSSGLLHNLDDQAVQGVLAHEVAHVANGDMVTMTLLQGVVNTFVVFLSRAAAFAVAQFTRGEDEDSPFPHLTYFIVSIIMEIFLAVLGSLVVMAFSRWREFGADAGGAALAGRSSMIHALRSLGDSAESVEDEATAVATLKIAGHDRWIKLFSSHPPLEERIARLEQGA